MKLVGRVQLSIATTLVVLGLVGVRPSSAQQKPNVVILMTDDTGWNDFGAYGGGENFGPSDAEDRSGRPGRRRIYQLVRPSELHCGPRLVHDRTHSNPLCAIRRRCAGDPERPHEDKPTIAEFFQKNGYSTYFSGK